MPCSTRRTVEPLTPPAAAPRASRESPSASRRAAITVPSGSCFIIWAMSDIQGRPLTGDRTSDAVLGPAAFSGPELGEPLARFFDKASDRGRPVWHAMPEMVVPRIYGGDPQLPTSKMPHRVLAFLETGNPRVLIDIAPGEDRVLCQLAAAVARDLLVSSPEEITNRLSYENREEAGKLAREGRRLWRRLGAWPWCAIDTRSSSWWLQTLAVELLHDWCTGLSRQQREMRMRAIQRMRAEGHVAAPSAAPGATSRRAVRVAPREAPPGSALPRL